MQKSRIIVSVNYLEIVIYLIQTLHKRHLMAKPNYSFEKKQKEMAKKKKKEAKRLSKIAKNNDENQGLDTTSENKT